MPARRIRLTIAALAMMLGATAAYAHNGIEHIMGTVTAITEATITVETVKHTSVTVLLDATTKFSKNDAEASRKDVKAGDRVAINAKENSDKKLVAVTVKLGAMANMDHGDHKK